MDNTLEFLARRNKGRRLLDDYLKGISRIIGVPPDVLRENTLNLEASDSIREAFMENIRAVNNSRYSGESSIVRLAKPQLTASYAQQDTGTALGPGESYFVTKASEFCGLVKISSALATANFEALIEYDGDFFGLVTSDGTAGLMIDAYAEIDGREFYEMVTYNQQPTTTL